MSKGLIVVLDVGKTLTKLSLWEPSGDLVTRATRPNRRIDAGAYTALDAMGIEEWVAETLQEFSSRGRVAAIFPVAHGAALAVLRDNSLACLPFDYEEPTPSHIAERYESARDAFVQTGSPRLPDGLNAGVQLEWLNYLQPDILQPGATIVTWAQYWAWRLSGVAATELTSLGCHTDLWRPIEASASRLAVSRGWEKLFAPLRKASEVLGTITPEWVERTGLPADVRVYCGIHDSNAALIAARGFGEIAERESSVLSTGTWFVAMRSPKRREDVDIANLPESRDCLVNVDAYGMPVPSARFMGGRELELLTGVDSRRIDIKPDQPALVAAVADIVASGAAALPTFAAGVGPFPNGRGRWLNMPADQCGRRAGVSLYAALVADASLGLIGAKERIVVEGRFAEAEVFVRGLASLRPHDAIYISNTQHDVSYGALRLINPDLPPPCGLQRVVPLETDLTEYAQNWKMQAARIEAAA